MMTVGAGSKWTGARFSRRCGLNWAHGGADRLEKPQFLFRPSFGSCRNVIAALAPCCLATFIIFVICLPTFAQATAPQKIRILCLARPLPVVIAESRGILAKYGIEVEYLLRPTSESLRSDLANGKGDVAFLAVDNDVAMVDSAGVDVVILMGGESSENELIAQPGIKSIADLRGRTLLVDAPNTAYALELKKVLLINGLKLGKDYEIKPVGSTPFRLQAMREHPEYAGAVMNPPFSIVARQAGMVSLGSMRTLLGTDLDRGTFALRVWARSHPDLLARYLAAYVEGQRWLLAPSNRQQVVALVMKESNLSGAIASEWYARMVEKGGYAKDAGFDVEGFKKTLKLRAEIEAGGSGSPPPAGKYYDLSFYRMALSKIK
jgi:ABC-type nitrate/sulfonate/bicarbonate transport system substrate-binding protein